MRTILTSIAVVLVVALSVALAAPWFIDWSRHRAEIEAELSAALGARVVVSGPIDIRFLPTPYLRLKNVSIADGDGAPAFVCDEVRLEAALASLPSGRARFTLARLDRPTLTLARGPAGSLVLPQWRLKAEPDRVALDRVVVADGRVRVAGGDGAPLEFDGVALDASAASLIGPYRGVGQFSTPNGFRADFQFATAAAVGSTAPIKFEIDPAAGPPRAAFDGALIFARGPDEAGALASYSGGFVVSGAAALAAAGPPTPWRVSGALHADLAGATLDKLEARLGPEERALEATGSARLDFGAPASLSADLKAKQLDVDALLRGKNEDSVSPSRALTALARALAPLNAEGGAPLALRVAFATPAAIVGAQTLSDVALEATAARGAPLAGRLRLGLPGRSTLSLSGTIELGAAAQFKGRLEARVGDFARLGAWAAKDQPELARRLAAIADAAPYREASAAADVEASAVGLSARDLTLTLDRTALTGAMAFTCAIGDERGRLYMDLRGDLLDVDALPNLRASADLIGDVDLKLALEAAKLRVARVGEASVEGGSLSLKMTKTADVLSLDRLSVAGLGGATVEARGAAGPQGRWLTVRLDADKLRDFAALAARVAPGRVARFFLDRADGLSPAKMTLEARASGPGAIGDVALDAARADGVAGQTHFTLTAQRARGEPGRVAASFTLEAPDGSALIRQFGLKAPAAPSGAARVEGAANGGWTDGFDARLSASIAGADLAWRGRFAPEATGDDAAILFGAATMKTNDATALLAAFGLGPSSAAPPTPVDLSADVVLRGGAFGFPRVSATVAGVKLAGRLRWRPAADAVAAAAIDPDVALAQSIAGEAPPAAAEIDGELSLDHASLPGLLSLPLGVASPPKPGAKWSDAPFAPPLVSPPPLDVSLKIGALDLADGLPARNATARLRIDRGAFAVDDFALEALGGRASGGFTLRRDGAMTTLNGRVALDSIALDRGAVRGRFGASLSFAGAGPTPSALVAGLVGEGQVDASGVAIARLDPDALGRVLAKAQAADAGLDQANLAQALASELDKQPLAVPDGTAPATMNSGVIHVASRDWAEKGGRATVGADFDLRSQDLTLRATLAAAAAGKFWSGPPPSVAATVVGALDAPTRQIDSSGLVAGLAAQAIARESDHITTLEQDIRERAYFVRRLKAEQYMHRREAELAAWQAEQARIRADEERKRRADELKASEAQGPPAPAPASPAAASPPVAAPKPSPVDPTASGFY